MATNSIQKFVNYYYNNRFIISCRIAAYRKSFKHFTDVIITEFDDLQIKQYISHWFNSETDLQEQTAANLWSLLQQEKYKNIKELAWTPLFLTFVCLLYSRSFTLPYNRGLFYNKVLRILLEEWAAEKRVQQDGIYQVLDTDLEEILLSKIAYYNFIEDRLFFSKEEITRQIKSFLASNLNSKQNINGEAVLNAIAVQQGILVERAYDIYSFSHLAMQEYLTAQYIIDNHLIENMVSNNLTDTRWQEVFLSVAGLMRRGTDELLLLMEKEAQNHLSTHLKKNHLVPLLVWSNTITKKDFANSHITPIERRLIALKYALGVGKNYIGYYCNNFDILTKQYAKNKLYINTNLDNNLLDKQGNIQDKTFIKALKLVNQFAVSYLSLCGTIETLNDEHSSELSTIIFNSIDLKNKKFDRSVLIKIERYCIEYFIDYSKRFQIQSIGRQIFPDVDFPKLEKQFEQYKSRISIQQRENNSFSKKEFYEISLGFLNKLSEVWFNAFQLTPDLINLSKKEIEEIDSTYFHINSLIIQCKEAAVRVSPETWEDIESRMLLPIENTN